MTSRMIYEIEIEGTIDECKNDSYINRYPIKLQIIKHLNTFQIWFKSGSVYIKCLTVPSELDAKRYINITMKLAMKNSLVYQICFFCFSDIFFPYINCKKCNRILDIEFVDWHVEKQIEKIPQHIFLFSKNVNRPSKRYISPILRPKTTKELRNF